MTTTLTVTALPVPIRLVMLVFLLRRLDRLLERHANFLRLLAWIKQPN